MVYESEYSSESSLLSIYFDRKSYFEMQFVCNTFVAISNF